MAKRTKKPKFDKLPKKIFVKRVRAENDPTYYLVADESAESMVDIGESVLIGVYELIEFHQAEGVVQLKPNKKK